MKKVAVIMGSDSDWPVVKGACTQLDALDIPYEAHILSATGRDQRLSRNVRQAAGSGLWSSAPPAWLPIWRGPLPPTPPCLSSAFP